jgi:exodeoxyribonuclease VII small subunit
MAELTLEQAMKRLEDIVEVLETEDVALDKHLQLYEEAMSLYYHCDQLLQAADKRIDILRSKADGTLAAEPFTLHDESSGSNGDNSPTTS